MGLIRRFFWRVWLAMRVLFWTLFHRATAEAVETIFKGEPAVETPPIPMPAAPPRARRSEAITLLATLQREARLVDFMQESLDGYTDAQIGAAVRDIHRDCSAALGRLFGLQPAVAEHEGAEVELPLGFDAARWRLTGNVGGQPPFRGRVVHAGWEASRCDLPVWSGPAAAAAIVAPAEIEVK